MRTTFSRLSSVTALIILVAVVGLGMSFRVMVKNYLADEQKETLQARAAAASELAADYVGYASTFGLDVSTKFHKTLSFASQFSQTDTLVCNTQGQVITCSCQEFWCKHIGMTLDPNYVQEVLLHGEDSRTGILTGVYEENRYLVAQVCTMSDGTVGGLVLVSEPVQCIGEILSQITQMFIFVALIVLLITVICFSIFSQNLCRPLKAMANAAKEFGHGNLKARVETSGDYTQEIDELAIAFNNMASSLEQSEYQRQEFVANVSHELKTPMTTIGGYVDGILDGTIPPERERKYLSLVSSEIKRLSRLVRSMLDVSRLQDQGIPPEKMVRFDVAECLGQVLITFEQKINDKHLDVAVNFPEYSVYAQGELDAITQVAYNLIDNAVKFCPPGGQLGLSLRESGSKVYVSVSNTGDTIPPEELPLVFDRFHKIDKSRSLNRDGWGLGLYIVKTIICSHGEDISVTSRDGKTEFTFTLAGVNSL